MPAANEKFLLVVLASFLLAVLKELETMSGAGRGNRGRVRSHQEQQPRRPGGNEADNSPQVGPVGIGRAAVRTREIPQVGNQPVRNVPTPTSGEGAVGGAVGGAVEARRGASRFRDERGPATRQEGFKTTGSLGTPIDLKSNYFQLIKKMDMHLLQYRVDFTPEVEHKGVKYALIRQHQEVIGKYSFDGTLLYNIKRLPQPLELASTRHSDGSAVMITFRLVNEIQSHDPSYTTVMNIIFRRCLGMLDLVLMRRDYFDPAAEERVQGFPIKIWPGYRTTINRHEEGKHLLLTEIIHKFLRQDTAFNIMDRLRLQGRDGLQERIKAELVGKIVMTVYNHRTYRIDDVDFEQNASSTFHIRREDRDISYAEYYRTKYELDIKQPSQPLLVSRPTRRDVNRGDDQPIFLIPELCGMTGLSEEQRNNFQLTRAVSTITRVNPDVRVQSLLKFRQRLARTPAVETELNSWGIQFDNNLISLRGRQLPLKSLILGGQRKVEIRDCDWSRSMHNATMSVTVQMKEWIVMYPSDLDQKVRSFVRLIKEVGRAQGFNVPEPHFVPLEADRVRNYAEALRNELSRKEYDIVMCVLRNNRADTYATIKKLTFSHTGVSSQVITGKLLNGDDRKQKSVATKVMTQIACKLGAEPWRVDIPTTTWMVAGYDTYHDARQRKAVGAFVASTNNSFTRFNSSVKRHEANEEISSSFRDHTITSLKAYFIANQSLPEKIIIYRDGIGIGDIQQVLDVEVEAIKSACKEAADKVKRDYNPGIAFVIVSKRINTRFFTNSPRSPAANPPCGTVVDNTVTYDDRFDFFLISQKVNQGTVSPTNFNVIYNSANLSPDTHQSVAYALTQLYYNWAGTLRVPAPVQYAHKLAYLVGEHMGSDLPQENLAKLPYYL